MLSDPDMPFGMGKVCRAAGKAVPCTPGIISSLCGGRKHRRHCNRMNVDDSAVGSMLLRESASVGRSMRLCEVGAAVEGSVGLPARRGLADYAADRRLFAQVRRSIRMRRNALFISFCSASEASDRSEALISITVRADSEVMVVERRVLVSLK